MSGLLRCVVWSAVMAMAAGCSTRADRPVLSSSGVSRLSDVFAAQESADVSGVLGVSAVAGFLTIHEAAELFGWTMTFPAPIEGDGAPARREVVRFGEPLREVLERFLLGGAYEAEVSADGAVVIREFERMTVLDGRGYGGSLDELVRAVVKGSGTVQRVDDRYFVVSKSATHFGQVAALVRLLDGARPAGHLVRVQLVDATALRELLYGLGVSADASLNASLAGAASLEAAVTGRGGLSAGLRESSLVIDGELHCVEGSKASLSRGQRIPVPQRRVSDVGSVAVIGHTFIDVGFDLEVEVSRAGGELRLRVSATLSSVERLVGDEVPVTSRTAVSTEVVCVPGEVVVLSGLEANRSSRSVEGQWGPFGLVSRGGERTEYALLLRVGG